MPILVAFGIPFGILALIAYFVCLAEYKDPIFFMRKRNFKKKLKKKGFENLSDFLLSLCNTSEKDWKKGEKSMFYFPFKNTKVVFYHYDTLLEIEVFEGPGERKMFEIVYYFESRKIYERFEEIDVRDLNIEEKSYVEQTFLDLRDIYYSMMYKLSLWERKKKKESEEEHLRNVEEQKEILLTMLESGRLEEGDFSIRFRKEKQMQSIVLLFRDDIYFQSVKIGGKEIELKFHNGEKPYAKVFADLEDVLDQFAKTWFEEQTKPLQVQQPPSHEFAKEHEKVLLSIDTLLKELLKEEQWLSTESFYQINETFPNDLRALSDVYRIIRDKEKVKSDVKEALHNILEKLENIAEEAENNKEHELKKRTLVIEKR